jgi:glycosyltransferase involved in cell wall biosynthesis
MSDTLLFFQNGDYREAYERFREGGEETYLDQRRSVDFVAGLAQEMQVVVASAANAAYDAVLAQGLRTIGIPRDRFWTEAVGRDLLDEVRPSRIIPRTGHAGLLRRIRTAATPCFPTLADIFQPLPLRSLLSPSGLKRRVSRLKQRGLFSSDHALAVGNHGLNASRSLHDELGVPLDRIVPWEWTRLEPDPEARRPGSGRLALFYAGMVTEGKGAGDLVEALRLLREAGQDVDLTICGIGDDLERLKAAALAQGLGERVRFLGRVPLDKVGTHMRGQPQDRRRTAVGQPDGDGEIGPGVAGGNNRQTLTDADSEGRRLFQRWCEAAGMTMGVDRWATCSRRGPGTDPEALPVYMGSTSTRSPRGASTTGCWACSAGWRWCGR